MMHGMKTAMALMMTLAACSRTKPGEAQRAAQQYMTHIKGATSVNCSDTDSDGDGYCSCDVFLEDRPTPLQIQCGCENWCWSNCVRGCKYVESVKFSGGRPAQ